MLKWFGDKITKQVISAAQEGAYITAEQVLTEAKRKCPQDTGTLRRSGTVTGNELPDAEAVFQAAESGGEAVRRKPAGAKKYYVSFNTPYAHKVHEDLSAAHNVGEAKFLEKAYNLKIKNFEKNVKLAYKRAIG